MSCSLALLLFTGNNLFSQAIFSDWVATSGYKGWDIVNGLACDSNGNVYITGSNTDTTLKVKTEKISTKTKKLLFLSKFDTTGKLLWHKKVITTESAYASLLVITPKNQLYLAGAEEPNNKSKNIDQKYVDFFIANLTTEGEMNWIQHFTGNHLDYFNSISVDSASGNLIIGGYFYDTLRFQKTSIVSKGKSDGILIEFDSNGKFLRSNAIGGKFEDKITSVTVNKWGNSCIAGTFHDKIQLNKKKLGIPKEGSTGIFLARYNSSMDCTNAKLCCWGKNININTSVQCGPLWILAGSFSDFLNINGQSIGSYGSDDIFLLCVDSSLNFHWIKHFGSIKKDRAGSIKAKDDEIILTGSFSSKLYIDNVSLKSKNESSDIFILSLDTTGKLDWVRQIGGEFDDYPRYLEFGKDDYIYLSGSFRGSLTTIKSIQSKGDEDIFIARLENCKKKAPKFKKPESFCQGNTLSLDAGTGYSSYNWDNGLCIQRNITIKTPGDYSLELQSKNGCIVYDTVKVIEIPKPVVFIGNDTTIVDSSILVLKTNPSFKKYFWSNGSKESTITIRGINCIDGINHFWVQVVNEDSCIGFSEIDINKVKSKYTIASELLFSSCVIFPNPATDQIKIYFTNDLPDVEIKLFDINGKALLSRTVFNYQQFELINFNVENYPAGLLTVTIKTNDAFTTKKIILE